MQQTVIRLSCKLCSAADDNLFVKMIFVWEIILTATVFVTTALGDSQICSEQAKRSNIIPDQDDCSAFYICHSGHQFRFSCASKIGPQKVFDPVSRTCVLQGSTYDHSTCKVKWENKKCTQGVVTQFAHEDNCAKYYQCASGIQPIPAECPYPRLFDRNTQKCELYLYVNCDVRKEPKDPCDYDSNQCDESGCIPCRARFGTCIGLPDGPNPWESKPWTPFFVICKDQRVLLHGDCRQGSQVNIFNPFTRECTSMTDILKSSFMRIVSTQ